MRNGGWYTVGERSLVICKRCGGTGVWRKSERTGRHYLAVPRRVNSDRVNPLWWVTQAPHTCQPPRPPEPTYEERALDVIRRSLATPCDPETARVRREVMVETFGADLVAKAES